jgi:hypothetical protein
MKADEDDGWLPIFLAPMDGRWIKVRYEASQFYPKGKESIATWIKQHNGMDGSSRTKRRNKLIAKYGGYWGKPRRGASKSRPYQWKPLEPGEDVVRDGGTYKIRLNGDG